MNPWPHERILEWLEKALVGVTIVRVNLMLTGVEMSIKEKTL